MNFLQICQKANTLSGLQGTVSSTTVTSGYQATLIEFCAQAFVDIQELRKDWPWMRSEVTFNTVAAQTEYTLANIFGIGNAVTLGRWILNMMLYVDTDNNPLPLRLWNYDRYILDKVAYEGSGPPDKFAQDPVDKHLHINPPDDAYSITGHFYTTPVVLVSDADIPLLPPSFHNLIAYQGAAHMSAFMGNSNLFQVNTAKADAMLGDLMRAENPGKKMIVMGAA
jgi:hypothetical protein